MSKINNWVQKISPYILIWQAISMLSISTVIAPFTPFISVVGILLTFLIVILVLLCIYVAVLAIKFFKSSSSQTIGSVTEFQGAFLNIKFHKKEGGGLNIEYVNDQNIQQWSFLVTSEFIIILLQSKFLFPENVFVKIKPVNNKHQPISR